jgi:P-type Ca2+ transporter type 2C
VFEGEPSERDAMNRPPRPARESLFGLRHIAMGMLEGLILLVAVYGVYLVSLDAALPTEQARALAFVCLVCGNLVMAFAAAAEPGTSLFDARRRAFWLIAAAATTILLAVVYGPPLANLFRFSQPPISGLAISFAVALLAGGWSGVLRAARARVAKT